MEHFLTGHTNLWIMLRLARVTPRLRQERWPHDARAHGFDDKGRFYLFDSQRRPDHTWSDAQGRTRYGFDRVQEALDWHRATPPPAGQTRIIAQLLDDLYWH